MYKFPEAVRSEVKRGRKLTVKSRGRDFTRMSVTSREGTKGDGMSSLCLLTTVGSLSEKLKVEIGKELIKVSRKRRRGFIKNMNKYMYQNNVSFA